ncbi:unnamed protein product [Allacma fusca]|uniref:Beta-ketoacyl synthase-like N-terminal domain-containing protein n=1 Tax=Allacma fusca TaxID=39272 RepID=A0A8J2PA59_9HEXA|nr:unnamed protein product [Allacma fusca]
MSGRFPESENLEIFWDNLRKGKDMVSENDERWERNAYDIPLRTGKIPSIDKDATFFGVFGIQAHRMDPKTAPKTGFSVWQSYIQGFDCHE